MTDKPKKKQEGLSLEELEAQNVEQLPDREEMSLVDVNVAIPFATAVPTDVLSGDPAADDEQYTTTEQDDR